MRASHLALPSPQSLIQTQDHLKTFVSPPSTKKPVLASQTPRLPSCSVREKVRCAGEMPNGPLLLLFTTLAVVSFARKSNLGWRVKNEMEAHTSFHENPSLMFIFKVTQHLPVFRFYHPPNPLPLTSLSLTTAITPKSTQDHVSPPCFIPPPFRAFPWYHDSLG